MFGYVCHMAYPLAFGIPATVPWPAINSTGKLWIRCNVWTRCKAWTNCNIRTRGPRGSWGNVFIKSALVFLSSSCCSLTRITRLGSAGLCLSILRHGFTNTCTNRRVRVLQKTLHSLFSFIFPGISWLCRNERSSNIERRRACGWHWEWGSSDGYVQCCRHF